ncbi:MAG: peptide methionine sulfoxide reductase MsrA 1 [Cyclobacteriaceae bacterium]|nr:MAG: peptide methionine sulfoxide reductase MsrA 1 [Cyclobacteriaceae bacterium]
MESKVIFGGGCFWCTEAIFIELKGVTGVKSGYSGGLIANPTYREVCSGRTGHAEVIEVSYVPEDISYETLLKIHLTTHDPTTKDRQGADSGTQYRSIIFYENEHEKEVAKKVITELQESFSNPIVTELKKFEAFYPAEVEHQEYYANNAQAGYCQAVISPKLHKFRKQYLDKLKKSGE